LLKKIVLFEILGFIIVTVAYWWFGASLLFVLLKVPDTYNYRLTGFIVIAGTFVWQIAMVMHKKYELNLRSRFLLGRVIIAFFAQILFYYLCRNSKSMLLYPMGFLLSALVYIMLVSFTHFRGFLNAILLKRAS